VMIERASRPGEPFDILLAWWYVDYADPYDLLNVLLDPKGNLSHFRSEGWDIKLEQVAQLSGPARYRAYGELALELARDAAPWVPYATGTSRDFFSARVGCQTFNPVYGMDLAALCLQQEPQRHQ
jgi:ABC-type transport system substrate-binding protein